MDALVTPQSSDAGPFLNRRLQAADVAWFDNTQRPGATGISVLAGHVNQSGDRPGVFGKLQNLNRGDAVAIVDDTGQTTTFFVRAIMISRKGEIPNSIYGPTPESALLLVTCGGAINPATGLHEDNLIVLATM